MSIEETIRMNFIIIVELGIIGAIAIIAFIWVSYLEIRDRKRLKNESICRR